MKTKFKIQHELQCRGVEVLAVCQYNALNEICFFGFSCKDVVSESKNTVGIWKIKQLKNK